MTRVGDGGELGEDARVPGVDFIELDVSNGFEIPVETRPLGVGERLSRRQGSTRQRETKAAEAMTT